MAMNAKPFSVLVAEKKSHRTKAELMMRKRGEESALTGKPMKPRPEIKKDTVAKREFNRLKKLLAGIQKDDAIYEGVINRYCQIYSECVGFSTEAEKISVLLERLEIAREDISAEVYFKTVLQLNKTKIDIDKQLQAKRKMLLDMEKENIMTVAAALRSVQKKENKPSSKLLEVISGGDESKRKQSG
ncbi:MAG: hypothetical protein FWE82_10360 [Defluviitaleaceae bacterium]|nr:hypothetical protein [Defluviitaleaceae bacterium]